MSKQISFVIDTLKFIQDGKVFTWRTPFLAVQFLYKNLYEKLGSLQKINIKTFPPEKNGEYSLMLARDYNDLQQVQNLYIQGFEEKYGINLIEKIFKEFPQLFFVLKRGENLVGYCIYTIDPSFYSSKYAVCLYSIAVDKNFRGGGHARYIIEKTLAFLKESSVSNVYLHVCPENETAIRLYEKIGFSFKRITKSINPKRNNMLFMEIDLSKSALTEMDNADQQVESRILHAEPGARK